MQGANKRQENANQYTTIHVWDINFATQENISDLISRENILR